MVDMQAGRELDVLIAKQLFNIDECEECSGYHFIGKLAYEIPHYSTTWEGMQLVVEEMQRRGWDWSLWTNSGQYTVEFSNLESGKGIVLAESSSAPHAVALAAIEALK